jgi:hypothetical protein
MSYSKRRRLSSSESTSPCAALFPINVLPMHYKKVLQTGEVHPAAIVRNGDVLVLAVKEHADNGVGTRINVLQTVRYVLPNNQLVGFEESGVL